MSDDGKKEITPFDFVSAASFSKENIMETEGDEKYIPAIVDKAFSYFPDSILYANALNNYHFDLTKQMQFQYYINTLRRRKRFSKWYKPEPDDALLETICRKYNCNKKVAKEYLLLFSDDDLNKLEKIREGNQ